MSATLQCHLYSDNELVQLVQFGERDAFNELVFRHRNKVLGWAYSITKDMHLAEDAAQESLIRAFLQLGTLQQSEKFLSWLKRIVCNHALMMMRCGGPYAKEKPFSAYMNGNYSKEIEESPLESALRIESTETLHRLLYSLSTKERSIFEAHSLMDYSPNEIAHLLSTTTTNVYTTISRSRRKLQSLYYHLNLTRYLKDRSNQGITYTHNKLEVNYVYFGEIWDSFALCVLCATQFTNKSNISIEEIMGLTGLSFRLQIKRSGLNSVTTASFHWPSVFRKGLNRLGYSVRSLGDGMKVYPSNDLIIEAYGFVQDALDKGQPVIVWGIRSQYFGLIHGYDDKKRHFHMIGLFDAKTIPYEELGLGWSSKLFVLTLGAVSSVAESGSYKEAIKSIIEHSQGKEEMRNRKYSYGLEAYDTWISHFENGLVMPFENAFMIWSTSNSRYFAAQFLKEMKERIKQLKPNAVQIDLVIGQAVEEYEKVVTIFQQLKKIFPFPHGGKPDLPEIKEEAIVLLEAAQAQEHQGIVKLEELLKLL
ncbi:sigma-70 family RNA polymerase sigma factor [Paenibacillus sp. GSMTC-2017]|uniref:RNA polymerase sigma factor n=1 Tax=Paenibacillus sp. GSMTC-2017 TaxID=2794350 RepID=UPI0018D8E030|nr:sigma-70 family RNA polymerase sigma factor [Paenibacillus sp. GSMTC-2017]MBH5318042.1 sigma-70 family RNA polymerase sigma factor [Paenibacillus sp. GSMTC-2017]